ncbi:MAG: CDP-diacylglycerol--serine O-phosphatidyltransferase [Puniceicoccaceae bacterium]|nr:MAG: CDP-diacylglycerol--serine O-phosphatidyltransferase [Puniceicoccaceae bacterium]
MSSGSPPTPEPVIGSAQASRIYLLPNLMTAGNLFCGFLAIIRCIQARFATLTGDGNPTELYAQAVWFLIAAVIFDSLDGRLARLGGKESLFGREFDSIADIVSFGVAPALMVFFLVLAPDQYAWFKPIGWFIGFIYLLCAAVRLARFNVITHPLIYTNQLQYSTKDFVGLPVPAAAGTIASLVLFLNANELERLAIFLPFLMLLIGYLMVSTIRYPSFKEIDWQTRLRFGTFIVLLILVALVWTLRANALVLIFLSYIGYGLIRHFRTVRRRLSRRRTKPEQPVDKTGKTPENT